eukprot:SAG22_NODE_2055_length_3069_cov_2.983502_3_plen_283_part_00
MLRGPVPELSEKIRSQSQLQDVYVVDTSNKNKLGAGAFSTVYLVKDRQTGEKKAVKRIAKNLMMTKKNGVRVCDLTPIEEEVMLQRECCANSKNIVQVFDVFDSGQTVDIVLEPMLKEDLFDAIEKVYYPENGEMGECRYSENEASKIARQVVSAVWACHSHNVCHRDLKPENILVHEYHPLGPIVKLCDFGLATKVSCKALPLPCVSTVFLSKTAPFHAVLHNTQARARPAPDRGVRDAGVRGARGGQQAGEQRPELRLCRRHLEHRRVALHPAERRAAVS